MDDIINEIPSMQIEELWNMYSMISEDEEIPDKKHRIIKYGHRIPLDIRRYLRYTQGIPVRIKIYYKDGKIQIDKHLYVLQDFDDEIDKRKALMRKTLMEYFKTESTTESRV